jgi:hypothetical protein
MPERLSDAWVHENPISGFFDQENAVCVVDARPVAAAGGVPSTTIDSSAVRSIPLSLRPRTRQVLVPCVDQRADQSTRRFVPCRMLPSVGCRPPSVARLSVRSATKPSFKVIVDASRIAEVVVFVVIHTPEATCDGFATVAHSATSSLGLTYTLSAWRVSVGFGVGVA